MTTKQKKAKIKKLAAEMLKDSHKNALANIDRALNSGAIDIDAWDENNGKMLIPKAIVIAILEKEKWQYSPHNTGHEKTVNKQVKNIGYFL